MVEGYVFHASSIRPRVNTLRQRRKGVGNIIGNTEMREDEADQRKARQKNGTRKRKQVRTVKNSERCSRCNFHLSS